MSPTRILKYVLVLALFVGSFNLQAQEEESSNFWRHVSWGGGIGLSFGNGYFSGTLAPSAIYHFNPYFSMGPSLILSYQDDDFFESTLYGGSWILLGNPIPEIQLSAEIEQLRVNQTNKFAGGEVKDNFWNTALFLGGGFRTGGVTIGLRYNVLFEQSDGVYAQAWNPFVRVYF